MGLIRNLTTAFSVAGLWVVGMPLVVRSRMDGYVAQVLMMTAVRGGQREVGTQYEARVCNRAGRQAGRRTEPRAGAVLANAARLCLAGVMARDDCSGAVHLPPPVPPPPAPALLAEPQSVRQQAAGGSP